MTIAEKDRILAMQGNLSTGAEEPRAELLRSRINWMWEVEHTMPVIRVERKLCKEFTTEADLVYDNMGKALSSAVGLWRDVQKARNVECPDNYPDPACYIQPVNEVFHLLSDFKQKLLGHGQARNPEGMLSSTDRVCNTSRKLTEAKLT